MASSLAEDLLCPICLALFQEPHMLRCGHNFCLACLRGAVAAGQEEGSCPECRSPFQLPELQRNRALGNLARKVRRWRGDAPEPLLPPGSLPDAWHFCEAHDEPLKLFCTQDEAPICVICRDLPEHRGHHFLPTQNAAQAAQGKLKTYLKHLEKNLKEVAEDESDQLKEMEALKSCTEDLLVDISKGFEALHQILLKKEQGFKLMVEKMNGENNEEMENSLDSLKKEASSRTETIAKVKAALEATDQVAFLKGVKELMELVKEDHQGEVEEDEETEQKSNAAEEKSDKDGSGEETGKESDDEDNVGYEPNETNHDSDRAIAVEPVLENFGESLDFNIWKKMLEDAAPKSKSAGELKRAKANDQTADDVKVKKARVETRGAVPNPDVIELGLAVFPLLSKLWEHKKIVYESIKFAQKKKKELDDINQKLYLFRKFINHEL
ncbi:nuclear factor 7, brain-like isoform X2 [Sphaerodactylus townsendi]|uniref:nuclear factor 7, brain-like isoform X2 n=1 Tax=Sphaerodactylus townsendi TaxID=933632 RepID=UPI002025D5CC|nr:nuclear factor 7, brain-like isoform X2 [Sphaerodactylus townsendi]